MKTIAFIFIWLCFTSTSFAQEEVTELSADMFQTHQRLGLASLDGWLYNEGSNLNWAQKEVDISDWKAFKPTDLSTDLADSNGRVEGWFRLTLKLDSSFEGIPLAISRNLWAATDIYINGALFHSFGDTGNPYTAYNPTLKYPIPIDLKIGKIYTFAVHFVDYETTFTQRELRLMPRYLEQLINLTGPKYQLNVTENIRSAYIFGTLSTSICFLLFFLFWLLVFLNPEQKIFKLIAWLATFTLLAACSSFFAYFYDLSYGEEKLRYFINISLQPISTIFGVLILEWILTKRISSFVKIVVVIMMFSNLVAHLFSISLPFGISFAIFLGYFVKLLYDYKNQITGANWAIVWAVFFSVMAATIYITIHKYSLDLYNEYDKLMTSLLLLGSPLFLLTYVSIRFKETLNSVKKEAKKVLTITEEKKELLFNQNLNLEKQVNKRTRELKNSLVQLQATQDQLVQQEKLASLGQLTAGIAHEIKNPLNFVTNFSEVSVEMIDEVREELNAISPEPKEALEILNDIELNLKKIHEHGMRADSIVKSMLQHSRGGNGEMEPVALNLLVKEYVNLCFHGMRASKKPINVDLIYELDETIGDVPLITEDFSRVIINLCNNAFDAMREKAEKSEEKAEKHASKLTIRTKKDGKIVYLDIEDNGLGIPEQMKDKILQPFFTTKKGTQGTGLGLSITNDIIKAHGGSLNVESEIGIKTKFTIILNKT